jgi:hypothetical protein
VQSEVGPKGLRADIGSLKRFWISSIGVAKKSFLVVDQERILNAIGLV